MPFIAMMRRRAADAMPRHAIFAVFDADIDKSRRHDVFRHADATPLISPPSFARQRRFLRALMPMMLCRRFSFRRWLRRHRQRVFLRFFVTHPTSPPPSPSPINPPAFACLP